MERIKVENLNGDTPLSVVLEYFKQNTVDKYPRERLGDFEHGVRVGYFKCIDTIEKIVDGKKQS